MITDDERQRLLDWIDAEEARNKTSGYQMYDDNTRTPVRRMIREATTSLAMLARTIANRFPDYMPADNLMFVARADPDTYQPALS